MIIIAPHLLRPCLRLYVYVCQFKVHMCKVCAYVYIMCVKLNLHMSVCEHVRMHEWGYTESKRHLISLAVARVRLAAVETGADWAPYAVQSKKTKKQRGVTRYCIQECICIVNVYA